MHWYARGLSCKPNIYVSWFTSKLRVRLAPWNRFKPCSEISVLTVPRRYFFCGSFVFLCLLFPVLLRLFIAALWSSAGKGLTSWPLSVMFIVFLLLSHVVSWSGVVLDCIVSWSSPPFLLCKGPDQTVRMHRLVWALAGHTYHNVGNLMSWLNFFLIPAPIHQRLLCLLPDTFPTFWQESRAQDPVVRSSIKFNHTTWS